MKHKNYDIIVAKAANMDLVVLSKDFYNGSTGKYDAWGVVEKIELVLFDESKELFLCLPQHKEACLHWLNGGDVLHRPKKEPSSDFEFYWDQLPDCEDFEWKRECLWMCDLDDIRIKPKKQKRWLRYSKTGVFKEEYDKVPQIIYEGDQVIEIEVEV